MRTETNAKLKIVVFISGNGSNLQAILDAVDKNNIPVDILAVISSNQNAYGLQRATHVNLKTQTIDPKDFGCRELYNEALAEYVSQFEPDLVLLAGFMHILCGIFLNQYRNKIINIHPSLLPKYPGLDTHARAIEDNATEHGCTVHLVDERLDSGPIIAQATITVKMDDTKETLKEKVHLAEHFLYPTVLSWFASKRIAINNGYITIDKVPLPETGFRFNING